jgi:hypothetical protein
MKLRKNVAISESGLVFNPVNGESFTVNPIGIEILGLLRQEKSAAEIISEVISKFATDQVTFDKDLADFIGLLSSYNLLEHEEKKA